VSQLCALCVVLVRCALCENRQPLLTLKPVFFQQGLGPMPHVPDAAMAGEHRGASYRRAAPHNGLRPTGCARPPHQTEWPSRAPWTTSNPSWSSHGPRGLIMAKMSALWAA
jgi:hypothetical protein